MQEKYGRFFLLIRVDLFSKKWTFLVKQWVFKGGPFFLKWGILQNLQNPLGYGPEDLHLSEHLYTQHGMHKSASL